MKKYNSFLGAFLSGDDGKSGYNAGYRKSALAELYQSQDPMKQQEALKGLARVDPEAAGGWQRDNQAAVQQHAKLLVALGKDNPVAVQAWETRVKPELVRMYGDQAAALTLEEAMPYAEQIAGQGLGGQRVHSQYMGADGKMRVIMSDGTEKEMGAYNPKYKMNVDAFGNVSGFNSVDNSLAPTAAAPIGGSQQGQSPQMTEGDLTTYLNALNAKSQELRSAGVPLEQINAWADEQVASLPKVFSANPTQARVGVKPEAPKAQTRAMSPQEIASYGLPAGTSATIDSNGSVNVLNKPAVEPKKQADANVVKQAAQLPSLLRRIQRVSDASKNLGFAGVDGGPIDQAVLRFSPSGQELESAVGQLRAMLLPFVRVPGVGSQSDLEARLDSLQYPDASQPPAVRKRNIDELNAFVKDLSDVYTTMIKGGQTPDAPAGNDDDLINKYLSK